MNNSTNLDLSVTIAGIRFRNPVIAASGTFGYGQEYQGLLDPSGLGGICTKGLTLHPREGNTSPRLHETPAGLMNSIGLENPGIPAFLEMHLPALQKLGPVIIANLSGLTQEEYVEGARLLAASSVDMIELNISCPNVKAGGMAFGLDPGTAASVVRPVRRVCTHKPLMVKLSPNAPNLGAVAQSCVETGADALSLVNTFKAMAIDIHRRKPVFKNIIAGLSGPAIRPIALRMVWELWELVQVPIVGMGGIANTEDALEFLMAGATAIQAGTTNFINHRDHNRGMYEIIRGITAYMQDRGMSRLKELNIRTS